MADIIYDINDFIWCTDHQCFVGVSENLFTHYHNHSFPNGRKQFYILNSKTGGFRRFRLEQEFIENDQLVYTFTSEDGIICYVNINISSHE